MVFSLFYTKKMMNMNHTNHEIYQEEIIFP